MLKSEMAYNENFESGTRGNFDEVYDPGSILDFPHYTTLARFGMTPYRGAYCMRLVLAGATEAYIQENAGFDFSASDVRFVSWYFYLSKDFAIGANEKFAMFNLESTEGTTVEAAAGIDRSGTDIRLWVAQTITSGNVRTVILGSTTSALNRWYHVELRLDIDAGAGNDGTINANLDGVQFGSQITGLDQAVPVDARFGAIGVDPGTSGSLLIDQIIVSTNGASQLFPFRERYTPRNRWIPFDEDHPIIGPGSFAIAVTGTGTNAVANLYDTDGVPNGLEPIDQIRNVSANESVPGHDIFEVAHGLYVTLSGTNAEAFISIECGGILSDAGMINRGLKQAVQNP